MARHLPLRVRRRPGTKSDHDGAVRHVYDRLAAHYDGAMRPLEKWFLARLRSKTLARIPANSRILEIGAGTGLNFPFYPPGARGVASELSRPMIVRAKQK